MTHVPALALAHDRLVAARKTTQRAQRERLVVRADVAERLVESSECLRRSAVLLRRQRLFTVP